eukprot:scaffold1850_cov194-Pinguiococcus_pyrenoidosus.AAC.61
MNYCSRRLPTFAHCHTTAPRTFVNVVRRAFECGDARVLDAHSPCCVAFRLAIQVQDLLDDIVDKCDAASALHGSHGVARILHVDG